MSSAARPRGRAAGCRQRQRRRQPDRRRPRRIRRRAVRRQVRAACACHRPARGFDVPCGTARRGHIRCRRVSSRRRALPLDRATAMALVAAEEAVRAAGLDNDYGSVDRERLGIFWGSGMAGAFDLRDDLPHGLCRAPAHAADERRHDDAERARPPNSRCASAPAAPPSPTHARARRPRSRSARRCGRSAPAGSTSPSPAAASRS